MNSPEPIVITRGGLENVHVRALLEEHLQSMANLSPPESCHAMNTADLAQPDVTFWTAWVGNQVAGCGALKALDARQGEIKSMRTASGFLRRGVAAEILQAILDTARQRGYLQVSLETGSMEQFEPARRFYEEHGFTYCQPFADYFPDPHSVFMTRKL